MMPTITAFADSPDQGAGLARDMRVRWALEEVGQPYQVRLVSFAQMRAPAHLALHPFGQIPTYEEGTLTLFESGAIVLHIAEQHPGLLLPEELDARARAVTWMFAALSTVEPPIVELEIAELLERNESWSQQRLPLVKNRIHHRLRQLAAFMGPKDWLDGAFSAADLMLVHVLLRLSGAGILEHYPDLCRYLARAQERPAYRRAFAAQLAVFTASQPST